MSASEKSVKPRSVALIGSPNSGKTTLYNWLTNSHYKTVNYPGATVDYSVGELATHIKKHLSYHESLEVMDTPGIYSLHPKSEDEWVTYRCLFERQPSLDALIVVVDGTQLNRHLVIAEQVKQSGYPFVLVITMSDLLRKNNIDLDLESLRARYQTEVILFNGQLGEGLHELSQKVLQLAPANPAQIQKTESNREVLKKQIDEVRILAQTVYKNKISQLGLTAQTSNKIDQWALHKFFGPLLFVALMFALFSSVFWLAAPAMDFVDGLFGSLSEIIKANLPAGLVSDFATDGVVTGIASFMVFTPQIFILFLIISFLEDSGYLARAAALIDKPFSKIGLSGRSFIPLLSGYACAIPAIMAARNLSSERDRKITQFIIPLMSCSARLPVYGLLLGFLFAGEAAWKPGLAMTGVYIFSVLVGAVVSAVIDKMLKKQGRSFLMMELPLYRAPKLWQAVVQSFKRTVSFAKNAGPMIFVLSIVMWVATTFPNYQEEDATVRTQTSYAGQAGHFIEPIVKPMGVDWRVGFSLITAFAAREVFVPSMAIMFNITDEDEEHQVTSLTKVMNEATFANSEEKIFTTASVVGLIIFFVIAMQCMSTFAVYRKETGSMKMALVQLIGFNVLAYVLAVLAYQILS